MKGKWRIKAIILIIQAQILFSAEFLGRLPQFSALLWLERPILIHLGDSVLWAYFLTHPEKFQRGL